MTNQECPVGINEEELSLAIQKEMYDMSSKAERQYRYETVLKNVLPQLGTNIGRIVLAQVIIALKIEGLLGQTIDKYSRNMVESIHEAIMITPKKKREAIQYAKKLIKQLREECERKK